MTRLRADLLLLLAAAIWGLAFVFQKSAMAAVGPLTFIAARGAVAALVLAPLAVAEFRRHGPGVAASTARRTRARRAAGGFWPPGLLRAGVAAGLAFVTAAALQQFGLVTASASNGGFLTALYVVLTPVLAWLLAGTRPQPLLIPAVLLSAGGTWLLGGGSFAALSAGDWLVAACAGVWALHVILSARGSDYGRPILFTAVQFAVVAAVASAGAVVFEGVNPGGLWAARGEILYVGVLSSALTFTLLTVALKHAPASEAAVIISTESLFAALSGALLLGERLSPMAWGGATLIMAAVLLMQVGPRGRRIAA